MSNVIVLPILDATADPGTFQPVRNEIRNLAHHYLHGRRDRAEITADTATRHRTVLRGFADSYGRRPARNLSRADIERWQARRQGITAGTRRVEWSVLRGFVRWLVQEGKVRRDPFVGMRAPKVPRTVPRAMPADDIAALLAVLPDERARLIVGLLYGLGLRRVELVRLEVGDYDRGAGTLFVRGKAGHERLLPVTPTIAGTLDSYLRSSPAGAGPLVRNLRTGGHLGVKRVSVLVRRWMEDAGVKLYPGDGRACHSLRHTKASEVAEVPGVPITVVQALLGHATLAATQVYMRRAELARVRAALEVAEQARAS